MSYCMPPECDGIPNPSRHAIEPDWVASECDDQLPAFSKIGRGPRGKGVCTEIEKTGDGQVIIHFKDDETGEEIGNTGDIAAGRISVSYAPENPVAGDEVKMFVSVRNGSSVANYVVPVPSGAHGSRIYLFPGPVSRNSDDTYQCSVDDLTIYGLQRWESKPEPRPNDVILFNYEDSDGNGFAFGTIEAVESGQVVYTARVFNTLPGVSILPDGTWAVDGESTGIKAQGPKGEDAKIKVRRDGDKAVITATDSDGETEAEVLDGKDGRDAKLSVQRVENGVMLTATDSSGVTASTVKDGSDGDDGSDGLPAMLTLGSVQETSQVSVTLTPGRVQKNEYIISFGLPRGADGKSLNINGGTYRIDQLPDFDETPINDAFIVADSDDRYDLYIRGKEAVIAEEGGPWTVVEDWQGVNGYSMRMLAGRKISTEEVLRIPVGDVETAFVPHNGLRDGDLVFDDNGTIGIVGSAMDDSGDYTVSYVDKMNVHWDNIDGKPEDLLQTSDIIQGDNIKVEADAQAGTVKISADIHDGAITGDMLAPNIIDTSKIIDGAVTEDKIAEGVIPPEYVLPVATEDILGGVKSDGETVSISDDGKISVIEKPLAKQVCGDVISVNDASAQKPLGLKVYGNTRQNLWSNPSGTSNGITVTDNADGSLSISGTSTGIAIIGKRSYVLKPSATYTASVDKAIDAENGFWIEFINISGVHIGEYVQFGRRGIAEPITFAVPSDAASAMLCVALPVNTTVSGTYRVMLNEGSEPQPWCPPGLNSIESLDIVTAGKNLLSVSMSGSHTNNGITFSATGDGGVKASGTSTGRAQWEHVEALDLPAGTYYLSGCKNGELNCFLRYVKNGSLLFVDGYAYPNGIAFTLTESTTMHLVFDVRTANKTVDLTLYPQLELGSTATEYEPPNVNTVPIDLQGNELRRLSDKYRDVLDTVSGNILKCVSMVELKNVIINTFYAGSGDNLPYVTLNNLFPMYSSSHDPYNSFVISDTWPFTRNTKSRGVYRTWNSIIFVDERFTDKETAKNIINETGGHIIASVPPTEIQLTPYELPALPAPNLTAYAASDVPCDVCLSYITEYGDVLSNFVRKGNEQGTDLSNYYTKEEVDQAITSAKEFILSSLSNSMSIDDNGDLILDLPDEV